MNVIILAAGQGTRLRPLTDEIPKCMVPVNGKSILERQVTLFQSYSFDSVVVIGGYRADKLRDCGAAVVLNENYEDSNMVYSLMCAEKYLQGDVIVSYGDIIYEAEVLEKILAHPTQGIAVAVDLDWRTYWEERFEDPLSDAESLMISDGRIIDIGRKVCDYNQVQGQYIGLIRFSEAAMLHMQSLYRKMEEAPALIEEALGRKKELRHLYMTDLLQILIHQEYPVEPVYIRRGWFEVDSMTDLSVAEKYLR